MRKYSEEGWRVFSLVAGIRILARRCGERLCGKLFARGRFGHPAGPGGDIPRWLSILHGCVNALVLAGLCLAGASLIATIVLAVYSCCERIILAVQKWSAFFGG